MWENFKGWLKSPYSEDMTALEWFYFFGLMLAIAVMWNLILRTVKEVA